MAIHSSVPVPPPTVGEIVEALLKLDQSLPLVVSTHYDNDTGHSSDMSLTTGPISYTGINHYWDVDDVSSPNPGAITAAILTG